MEWMIITQHEVFVSSVFRGECSFVDEPIRNRHIVVQILNDHLVKLLELYQVTGKILARFLGSGVSVLVHSLDQFHGYLQVLERHLMV
jgi:hypothetical protein